jgi:1-acyl-sn-glycerol-3-phosphate acyltransferase
VIFYRVVRAIVLTPFKLLFRVKVLGRANVPRGGAYIVAPSHRSIFDVPFTAYITRRRIRMMAKRELFSTAFGAWLFRRLGAIEVEREVTDRSALRASQQALTDGEPLAIFPEGTRRNGPTIDGLFDGVAYLALKSGVPIVPVGVGGTEAILPSGKVMPRLHKVAVVVGEPIVPPPAEGVRKRSEVASLTAELQARLQACFDEALAASGTTPDEANGASAPERREHV